MICGPIRPVSGLCVHSTSPANRALRPSTGSTALPAVCPGACTTLGRPGTSSISPSPNVDSSLMVSVRVRQHDGIEVLDPVTECPHGLRELGPVLRRSRVDEDQLAAPSDSRDMHAVRPARWIGMVSG